MKCSQCGKALGPLNICWPCSAAAQPPSSPYQAQPSWSGSFIPDLFGEKTIKLSDEDIDKIAQAVLDKLVRGLGL